MRRDDTARVTLSWRDARVTWPASLAPTWLAEPLRALDSAGASVLVDGVQRAVIHACMVAGMTLPCWGNDNLGQLGGDPRVPARRPYSASMILSANCCGPVVFDPDAGHFGLIAWA